ncbi:MAG: polyphenol oxidase family protein [Chloroflexi bacterium]|nr:polyphenol oxidase family protein [Chloroflexota bacterium]
MDYADCTPIFLYDPEHQAIGLGHAGWQGTVQRFAGGDGGGNGGIIWQ